MISLKRYLDQTFPEADAEAPGSAPDLLSVTAAAYQSALVEMGNCAQVACPALGDQLKRDLGAVGGKLKASLNLGTVRAAESDVREELAQWGQRTARHYQEKTGEVKEMLLAMARAAESVGERDQRYAGQIGEVTARLKSVANLEDISEIRESIQRSATELKSSIDRMEAEGKAVIDGLQAQVSAYRVRLEEAEQTAARDTLTGVRSRLSVEGHIQQAVSAGTPFCVAVVDLNDFKQVNDRYGHVAGDELLRQFACELQSNCRAENLLGRWGGDEFIVVLPCALAEAQPQAERLMNWACGNYTLECGASPTKLRVEAAYGLSEWMRGESMTELIGRADAEMYQRKASAKAGGRR